MQGERENKMKKTTFKGITLIVSEIYGESYEEFLIKNGIDYSIREIDMSNINFTMEVSKYTCYELIYESDTFGKCFAYQFVTCYTDDIECKTFISGVELPESVVKELEKADYKNELKYEPYFKEIKKFGGFDFDKFINLSELVGKYVQVKNARWEFYEHKWFPDGIYGKVIDENGNDKALIFLMQNNTSDLSYCIEGTGWRLLSRESAIEIFGKDRMDEK